MNIETYAQGLKDTIPKDDLVTNLIRIEQQLSQQEHDLDSAVEFETKIMNMYKDNKKLEAFKPRELQVIQFTLGIRKRKALRVMRMVHSSVISTVASLLNYIERHIANTIVTEGATARQLSVIAMAEVLSLYVEYTARAIPSILYGYLNTVSSKKYSQIPSDIAFLKDNEDHYADSIKLLYGRVNVKDMLLSLPDIVVTPDNGSIVRSQHHAQLQKGVINQLSQGFIGNPIYHVLKWISDVSIWRIRYYKSKRDQIELLKIAITAELEDNPSAAAQKELDVVNDRLAILNRDIKEGEESSL